MKMRRICATPHLGEELLEKVGILEKTPEKKVEPPRKKGEPKKRRTVSVCFAMMISDAIWKRMIFANRKLQ